MFNGNELMTKSRLITLKVILSDFQEAVIQQIKKENGIDLTGKIYCGIDDETNGIFIDLLEYNLSEEENDKLHPYSIYESYENTKIAIASMLDLTNAEGSSMYAINNSKRSPIFPVGDTTCEITIYN